MIFVDRFDHSKKDRDADAVDQLGLGKVDHDPANALTKQLLAMTLHDFASELIQVRTGVDYGYTFYCSRFDLSDAHTEPPRRTSARCAASLATASRATAYRATTTAPRAACPVVVLFPAQSFSAPFTNF